MAADKFWEPLWTQAYGQASTCKAEVADFRVTVKGNAKNKPCKIWKAVRK